MKNWLALLALSLQLSAPLAVQADVAKTPVKSTKATPRKIAVAQTPGKPHFGVAASFGDTAMARFVSDLMAKMTLEEKIGQLNLLSVGADVTGPIVSQGVDEKISKGLVGGVFNLYGPSSVRKLQQMVVEKSRLKIPMIFGYDVIHGHRTIFPLPLALSCSFDMPLIERTAAAAAAEASADGLNWTFSPMVDIARDPRWGRVMEGSGEDIYLGSKIAKAMVRGYQGDTSKNPYATDKVMACVKHFALYGGAEAGRDYNTVDMSRVRMFNEYLPPYKAAVDAGVASAMSSFNEVDGIPATGNKWLMTELLRKQWGFKGFVATDYTAVTEMIAHGMGDEKKVTELALNAGIDMDMVGELFIKYGPELVKSGAVSMDQIDAACRRVLEAKYKLGLFSDPYRFINEDRPKQQIMSADKIALSKEAAIKSMVLLKNQGQVLPLTAGKKVAFIGPLVKDEHNLIGSWSGAGQGKEATTLWQGLVAKFGQDSVAANFTYAKGCNLLEDAALIERLNRDGGNLHPDAKVTQALKDEAVSVARQADVVVACLGEPAVMSGEAASRSQIGLFEHQIELLKALKATGKPVVLVLSNGRPLTLAWEDANLDAILEGWFGGTRYGDALTDVLFGEASPTGKLSMTFPRNVGQVPIYYSQKNTGRPFVPNEKYHSQYLDVSNTPLYPFGYGLTYTSFDIGAPTVSSQSISASKSVSEPLTVSVQVSNTGKRDGVECVQLYVRDLVGSITRPVKELKGFEQVALKAGESKTITFKLTADDLRFYNSDLKFVFEPGEFKVMVGANSRDLKEAPFTLR
jgi:beta-glucosidase